MLKKETESMDWLGIGTAASGIAGGLVGKIGQKKREQRQLGYQKELMDLQQQNQMALNQQGKDLAYQQWLDTNAQAQMKELQKAGLNPALMYGGSGPGGATAVGSGGGAAGGSAPGSQEQKSLDIGSILSASQMAADLKMKKAAARKTNADAETVELDNEVKRRYGQEADIFEASNRRDSALKKGQVLFEGKEPENDYERSVRSEVQAITISKELQDLVKQGQVSSNAVAKYKADLAKAKIDPDSNPLVREMMKAMAAKGVPVSKILERVVEFFLD